MYILQAILDLLLVRCWFLLYSLSKKRKENENEFKEYFVVIVTNTYFSLVLKKNCKEKQIKNTNRFSQFEN